ncbi:tRNA pseudouridine(55) synthase TruB [bacterium]|nr:tRNA pseudouridine(55) synthase TruB [bacterium]
MTVPPRGFLLIDKPRGISSYGVIDAVKRTLGPGRRRRGAGRFRCGHAGTLDPLATGLLLVLCGPETRLSTFLLGHDKRYEFTVRLGATTETLDTDGETMATGRADYTTTDVEAVLDAFKGDILQIPPVYSALKRDGKPLYALAREGAELPDLAARPVRIDDLAIAGDVRRTETPQVDTCDIDLIVTCSSGTYVRSLARDIAEALGTVGHVSALRRTRIGPFDVAGAIPPEAIKDGPALTAAMRPAAEAMIDRQALTVVGDEAAALRQGVQPDATWLTRLCEPLVAGDLFRMLDEGGALVAVGRMEDPGEDDDGEAVPRLAAVFPPPAGRTREDAIPCD